MIKSVRTKISLILGSILILAIPAATTMAAPDQPLSSEPGFFIHQHWLSGVGSAQANATSDNWSGYASTGANNTFSSVSSSWVQPTLNCSTSSPTYSAYWVGLDGFYDQTVEQIGTEGNCVNGSAKYYTWYEMYPQNPYEVLLPTVVSPGNSITASVVYNPGTTVSFGRHRTMTTQGSFTLVLVDTTTGVKYSATVTASRSDERSSAEVIAEAPYSGGILPLANFGTVNFTSNLVDSTALGSAPGLQEITMDNPAGMIATPSAITGGGENFSVAWSN